MSSEDMKTKQGAKKFQKSYFDVLGLCCSSEVPLVENILKSLDGVKQVTVVIATRTVIVVHDSLLISQTQIAKALNDARLEASIRVYGEKNLKNKWPSPYAMACGVLLTLSFLKYVYRPLEWLALGAVAIGILPICLKAVVSIRNFSLDINILAIVAVIGTVSMRDYLEAGTIVFLFTVAEWLESRASHKANAAMSSLMSMVPQKAVIAETGEVVEADEVKLNTILAVKAGEVIPIDGIVVEGNCEVDEKTLTGESFPVSKQKDSTLWAGTINLNGYVTVKTTALAEDCAVAKMAKLVEEAQNSKSKTQRFIDKCAKFYTPAVLLISISVAVIPAALRLHNLKNWFHLALVILVSACPCGLILSTPVATFCALTKAATSGLLIKGGDYLEILAGIKIMAFDKTGTITRGEFVVTNFQSLREDIGLESLLYWVSSIESKSSHPMAAALVDHGKSMSVEPKPENVEEFENFPGEGIHGRIDGQDVYIGNKKISARASCETVPTLEGYAKDGKSVGYIYCGGKPAGIFTLSDACRSGVAEAIAELKKMGIKTAMLTGDSNAAAMHTHEKLGHAIEVIRAELLPEDKAKLIKEFKKQGPTAMIGDGLNDAPALATADIGISMGISGSALATETGHVILLSNDIRKIPKAIKLSRQATRKVMQNIFLSITTKAAIVALAIAGHPLVWAAVLADVGTCLLVIFNSMLLLREPHTHGGKCCKSSSTNHVHKHGCSDGHTKLVPHKDQECCSNKTLKVCKSQKCSSQTNVSKCQARPISSGSCCEKKRGNSADKHNGCASGNEHHESQHRHHGGCQTANHDLESQHAHDHSCLGSQALVKSCLEETNHDHVHNSNKRQDCSAKDDHHGHHHHHGHHDSKHCDHSVFEESENLPISDHIHSSSHGKNHIRNESFQNADEPICGQQHHQEVHSCSKNHDKDHTTIDVMHGVSQAESDTIHQACLMTVEKSESIGCCGNHKEFPNSATMKACMSLEKREFGGCCKSYMKKCCNKHGHFGAPMGVGLSEVIID
ncbi:putative inactive cadmium/zinc-transporting ATPase HMA3 [Humulus lupulus]|uniref:putative inactive cadmium/zinc-transporting ATPase HMA3 n=1 Tax=Humulus lupulus TaxID=3486 RepID=UPI002B40B94E|nr:putative inactive cadmium/zinc-transporting ATPase HMA3 [Humulus lupulus]